MTKPRLEKVRALFYVFQQIFQQGTKRGCAYFDTASNKITFNLPNFFGVTSFWHNPL